MIIGRIPYLNSVLFYHGLAEAARRAGVRVTYEDLVPRRLSLAAEESRVVAGPVPLVTTWDLEGRYDAPVTDRGDGDFCIASVNKAHSILLYSRRPFEALDGAEVGVTAETSTSVRLLKVLLSQYWNVRPARFGPVDGKRDDAFLLIGDEALRCRGGVPGFEYVADLGEVWYEWTGLPFVFARWVVRADADAETRSGLVGWIDESMRVSWPQVERIVAPRGEALSMTTDQMREYLDAFHFRMGRPEHEAVARFRVLDGAVAREYGQTAA